MAEKEGKGSKDKKSAKAGDAVKPKSSKGGGDFIWIYGPAITGLVVILSIAWLVVSPKLVPFDRQVMFWPKGGWPSYPGKGPDFTFTMDGNPIRLSTLFQPVSLRHGQHELVIFNKGQEAGRVSVNIPYPGGSDSAETNDETKKLDNLYLWVMLPIIGGAPAPVNPAPTE